MQGICQLPPLGGFPVGLRPFCTLKGKGKSGALAWLALHADVLAMGFNDALYDGQAQPRPALAAGGMGLFRLIEPIEQIGDILLGHSLAAVRYPDPDQLALRLRGKP